MRFFILNAHYRKPLNYSKDVIASIKSVINRLRNSKKRLQSLIDQNSGENAGENCDIIKQIDAIRASLIEHMDDDLNTPDAVTDWISLSKLINTELDENTPLDVLNHAKKLFDDFVLIFGVIEDEDESLDVDIENMIRERELARKNKDYKRADEIRDELKAKGIELKDTKDGVVWQRV